MSFLLQELIFRGHLLLNIIESGLKNTVRLYEYCVLTSHTLELQEGPNYRWRLLKRKEMIKFKSLRDKGGKTQDGDGFKGSHRTSRLDS